MRRILTATAFSLAAVGAAAAEPYAVDKSHTIVTFEVGHLGYSTVHGVFRNMDAVIDYDAAAPDKSSVKFEIDAASLDTFWEARDKHIKSADFFNVEKFPKITFVSKKVEKVDEDTAKVTGDLTLLDKTNEEVFMVDLTKAAPNPMNQKPTVGFKAEGKIDRTKYGMGMYAPAISAEIPVRIDLEMSPGK